MNPPNLSMDPHKLPIQRPWALWTARALIVSMCWAQVLPAAAQASNGPIADPRAPLAFRPQVLERAGAAPVVNITAPNAAGMSLNQFERFDVPAGGVVLNNSLIGGVPLMGGSVPVNPNLSQGRTATAVINEVTQTGRAGELSGTIEVFGAPAAVIVANPNGISCNGCGVVNASRLTLSTGAVLPMSAQGQSVPDFAQAQQLAYEVHNGVIHIQGMGVEGTVGRLDLIGERIDIDAPLRAHYLNQDLSSINLAAGRRLVIEQSSGGYEAPLGAGAGRPVAGVAIDASLLGAMTAGQIRVISTDQGMGVNLRGPLLAYRGDLQVQADGPLHLGSAASARHIQLDSSGQLTLSGETSAGGSLTAHSGLDLRLEGLTKAQGDVTLTSGRNLSVGNDLYAGGQLSVDAVHQATVGRAGSRTQVGGGAHINAGTVQQFSDLSVGQSLSIDARDGVLMAGRTHAGEDVSIASGGGVSVQGSIQANRDLTVQGTDVQIQAPLVAGRDQSLVGSERVTLEAPATAGRTLSLQAPKVAVMAPLDAANIQIAGDELTLGRVGDSLSIAGDLSLNMTGQVHVQSALDVQGNARIVGGGSTVLDDAVNTGGQLYLQAHDNLLLHGPITAAGDVMLLAGGQVTADGAIGSAGTLHAIAGQDLRLQGPLLSVAGQRLEAGGKLTLAQGISAGALSLTAGQSAEVQGPLRIGGDAQFNAPTLRLAGDLIAGGSVLVAAGAGGLDAGNVTADVDLVVTSAGQVRLGTAQALRDVRLVSEQAAITLGPMLAGRHLNASAADSIVVAGAAQSGGDTALLSQHGSLNIAGNVVSGGQADLRGQGVAMRGLQAQGAAVVDAGHQSLLSSAAVVSGGELRLTAGQSIDVSGPVAAGAAAQVQAGGSVHFTLLDTGGSYTAVVGQDHRVAGPLIVRGAATVDAGGEVAVLGDAIVLGDMHVQTTGAQTYAGTVHGTGVLQLHAGHGLSMANDLKAGGAVTLAGGQGAVSIGGSLATPGQAQVEATGVVTVGGDTLVGGGRLRSSQGSLTLGGQLQSTDPLALHGATGISVADATAIDDDLVATSTQGDVSFADRLDVAGNLQATAGRDLSFLGDSRLLGGVQLQAATADPNGRIVNQGHMRLAQSLRVDTAGDFINEGQILVPGDIDIRTRHLLSNLQTAGGLAATGLVSTQSSGSTHLGSQGYFSAGVDMDLNAQAGLTNQGQLQAGQALRYSGGALTSSGQMAATSATVAADLQHTGGFYAQDITVTGSTANGGQIAANTITMAAVGNSGQISGQQVKLGATDNGGGIQGVDVQIGGATSNTGSLGASGSLDINAGGGGIYNGGAMLGDTVTLSGGNVANAGQMQSGGLLSISAQSFSNTLTESQRCVAGAQVCAGQGGTPPSASDYRWTQSPATVVAGGPLQITAGSFDNQAVIQSGGSATVSASASFANTRSANDLFTDANAGADAPSTNTGIIQAGGALNITSGSFNNSGQLQANGALTVTAAGGAANTEAAPGAPGQMVGASVSISAPSLQNQGLIQARSADVTLTVGAGGFTNTGTQATVATPTSLRIASGGGVTNAAGASLLADNAVRVNAASFTNAGTVYGQSGPSTRIDITTAGAIGNAASGIVIAGSEFNLQGGSYSNAGVVGSFGNATLVTSQVYAPAANPLIAKGQLDLQVAGVTVGAHQFWASDAASVSWSGTLTNHGAVELAGSASGDVLNQYTGQTFRGGEPDPANLDFRVETWGEPPPEVVSGHIVGYTDVAQRAYFSAASLNGTLTNEASDVTIGSTGYRPIHVEQAVFFEGVDKDGKVYQWSGSGKSLARADASAGAATIVLQGSDPGTIVADNLTLIGGDLTLDSGLDPATGQPLVEQARQRLLNAGAFAGTQNAAPVEPATDATPTPQAGQNPPGSLSAGQTPASSALAGAPAAAPAFGASAAPGRDLGLRSVSLSNPQAGVAALLSGRDAASYQIQLPQWNQMRGVPGGITAQELNLQLSGQFTNRSDLQVDGQLILNAEQGIDNFGAVIRAGGPALLSGGSLNNSQGLIHASSLYARTGADIVAEGGQFQATHGALVLDADGNIALNGTRVQASQGVGLQAAGDITLGTQVSTSESTDVQGARVITDKTVRHQGTTIDAADGPLQIIAGGDVSARGSVLQTQGQVSIAGRNVSIEAAKDSTWRNDEEHRKRYDHKETTYSESLVGGEVSGGQGVRISAHGDAAQGQGNIELKGAVIDAGTGAAVLSAQRDINVQAVHTEASQFEETYKAKKNLFSSKSSHTIEQGHSSLAQGSTITGDTVTLVAERDIEIKGSGLNEMKDSAGNVLVASSGVLSQNGTTLVAGRDVRIVADEHSASGTSHTETKKSGLFASGFNLNFGKQSSTTDRSHTSTQAAGSTVGSVHGNTAIVAVGHYQQSGSDVLSGAGDVSIQAQSVAIEEAREIEKNQFETRFKQSGLSVGVGGAVIDTATTVVKMGEVAGRSSNTRTQVMAGAAAGLSAYNNADKIAGTVQALNAGASPLEAGLSLNISLGSSKSESKSSEAIDKAKGSRVAAGGNVTIQATDGDIKVQGSQIDAAGTASLIASQGEIQLLAAANTHQESSSSKSSSGSVGVSISAQGVSVNASASRASGNGQGSGSGTSYNNTQVNAGQGVVLQSGGDTTLKGSVITAPKVSGEIGGNLHIESLQDTAVYDETSKSSGFSVSVPIYGAGSAGGSISSGRTSINSNHQSVGEQSGIKAGDGGFQIDVGGTTTLKGGVISSTEQAVQQNKNSFQSPGGISTEDIQNTAAYSADSYGVSLGFGNGKPSGSGGVGSDSGKANSTSQAGISGVAGNTQARTGDTETGLKPIFDKDKVQTEVQDQVTVTTAFNKEAAQAWGTYSNNQFEQARQAGDEEGMQCWGPTGGCRAAGHAAWGGLSGGGPGALAAGGTSMMAPVVYQSLVEAGMPKEWAQVITVTSAAVAGNAAGGPAGSAAATSEAANNGAIAVPFIVEGVVAAGTAGARACVTSPACMNVIKLAGTAAVAKVVAIASTPTEAGAPGYVATPALPNHTGNQSGLPDYAGTGTTTPNNGPASGNTTTSPVLQPGAGSEGSSGGFAAGGVPVFSPVALAVPLGDRAAIDKGITGVMGGQPAIEPATSSSNQISRYPEGTWADANRVFDAMPMSDVRVVSSTPNGDIRRGVLPDGTAVIVRPTSSDGTPTIQVQDSNRPSGRPVTVQEIRFGLGDK